MRTIAELKAEIVRLEEEMSHCGDCLKLQKLKKADACCFHEWEINKARHKFTGHLDERQSLSQKIDSDVGKCENKVKVENYPWHEKFCYEVPEPQKCQKCQGKLEIKK